MVSTVIEYPLRTNAGEDSVGPEPLKIRPEIGKDHDGLKTALKQLGIEVRLNTRNQRIEYRREKLSTNEKTSPLPLNPNPPKEGVGLAS